MPTPTPEDIRIIAAVIFGVLLLLWLLQPRTDKATKERLKALEAHNALMRAETAAMRRRLSDAEYLARHNRSGSPVTYTSTGSYPTHKETK